MGFRKKTSASYTVGGFKSGEVQELVKKPCVKRRDDKDRDEAVEQRREKIQIYFGQKLDRLTRCRGWHGLKMT